MPEENILWKLSLKRLKEKVRVLDDKVEDALGKMIRDPRYDSYSDISAASGGLSDLIATI